MTDRNDNGKAATAAGVLLVVEPLLLRAPAAARICGVSTRTWRRLAASGITPSALKIGGVAVWRLTDLAAWAEAGCPARDAATALPRVTSVSARPAAKCSRDGQPQNFRGRVGSPGTLAAMHNYTNQDGA